GTGRPEGSTIVRFTLLTSSLPNADVTGACTRTVFCPLVALRLKLAAAFPVQSRIWTCPIEEYPDKGSSTNDGVEGSPQYIVTIIFARLVALIPTRIRVPNARESPNG